MLKDSTSHLQNTTSKSLIALTTHLITVLSRFHTYSHLYKAKTLAIINQLRQIFLNGLINVTVDVDLAARFAPFEIWYIPKEHPTDMFWTHTIDLHPYWTIQPQMVLMTLWTSNLISTHCTSRVILIPSISMISASLPLGDMQQLEGRKLTIRFYGTHPRPTLFNPVLLWASKFSRSCDCSLFSPTSNHDSRSTLCSRQSICTSSQNSGERAIILPTYLMIYFRFLQIATRDLSYTQLLSSSTNWC